MGQPKIQMLGTMVPAHAVNDSQLAKMKKSIPDMSPP